MFLYLGDKDFPKPENNSDWKDYMRRFLNELLRPEKPRPLVLPKYNIVDLPKAKSLDGMLAMVQNDIQGVIPVYSAEGEWRRFSDNSPTSEV